MTILLFIVILLFIAWFWYQSSKVHEYAISAAKSYTKESELQLLDDTVALRKIRLVKDEDGRRCLQRIYRAQCFDSVMQKKQLVFIRMNGLICVGITSNASDDNIVNLADYRDNDHY